MPPLLVTSETGVEFRGAPTPAAKDGIVTSRLSQLLWLTMALLCGSALAEDTIRWAPDLATASRAAAEFKVPLLVHFYGDGCLPCKTLEHRVFSQPEIISNLNRFFICVKINATSDRESKFLAQEFGVHSWPTDVFVSPDGKTLFQGVCPQDPRAYAGILENVKVMNRDRNVVLAAQAPQQPAAGIAQQLNNVGSQPYAGQLPAPGMGSASNSTSPTFYTASSVNAATQQLPNSSGPGSAVQPSAMIQHGPIHPGNQPGAIMGSTPGASQQLTGPARGAIAAQLAWTASSATSGAHLPPVTQPVGRMQSPQSAGMAFNNPSLQPKFAQQPVDTPTVPAGLSPVAEVAAPAPSRFGAGQNPSEQMSSGQIVQNPHFKSPNQAVMAQTAVTQQPVGMPFVASTQLNSANGLPSQTVSFQPRSTGTDSANGAGWPTGAGWQGQSASGVPSAQHMSGQAADTLATSDVSPALEGYCPVALRQQKTWVAGDPRYAVRHRGRVYWMNNQTAMSEFLRAPDVCSPKFSGYDPMLFLREGKLVDGKVEHGLFEEHSGSFLFFSNAQLKSEFEQQFDKNARALDFIMQQAYTGN